MEDNEGFEVQKSNRRLINEISNQNQGGNEKKNSMKKMAKIEEEGQVKDGG